MTTKTCSKCGETKDVSGFGKDRNRRDGLRSHCKACNSERWRAYLGTEAGREANRRSSRKYNKSDAAKGARRRDKSAYNKRQYATNPAYAMTQRMRRRLSHALKGQAKPSSTMDLVGCSPEKLCAWLEMHFDEGMTWENRGEWHIDHIRPIASFEDPADPACWHWSNLQPLWAKDNLRKSDVYDGE